MKKENILLVLYHLALFNSRKAKSSENQNTAKIIFTQRGDISSRFFIFVLTNGLKTRGMLRFVYHFALFN